MHSSLIATGFPDALAPLLGAEQTAFAASFDEPPAVGLRVNTLKLPAAALRVLLAPLCLTPVAWCPAGFSIDDSTAARPASLGKSPRHAAGLYYLQDPSAMAVAEALAPAPGARVLDLCAAPGGKATHLAALMQDQGLLVANETTPARAAALAANLERWGARQTIITNETPARLAARWPGFFDAVLVDAPCSGEGMFRRLLADGERIAWSLAQTAGCALRQNGILMTAAQMVRPGGILVYSTCTFNLDENERVVARFLDEWPDFELTPLPLAPGWTPGLGPLAGQAGIARLWPHRLRGEGHFIARLRRRPHDSTPPPAPARSEGRPTRKRDAERYSRQARQAWQAFCVENLTSELPGELVQTGAYLYQTPAGAPDLQGLRVLRPGWWLGEARGERLLPAHALALGLPASAMQRSVSLPADDPALLAYLRGETLQAPGPPGWLAVCADGFPLGWGKRSGATIKNHYPKGLRSMG